MQIPKKLIKEIESVKDLLLEGNTLLNLTIQNLDLRNLDIQWEKIKLANTTFLGCEMSRELELLLREKGAMIYPQILGLPYNPYRRGLYTWQELMSGYNPEDDQSADLKIYRHFQSYRLAGDVNESLAQTIHDHAINDALRDALEFEDNGMTGKKCVGIMGGHALLRNDPVYEKVARLTKLLSEAGFFILSGGGPGVMEAANFGAYFAGKTEEEFKNALDILAQAPSVKDNNFNIQAQKVLELYTQGGESISIPTWFYGHEPSNLFSTKIAKYFSNAIREEMLLASSLYGIVYAPGSAGTLQEIFADMAQNYYQTYVYSSPMVFFDKKFWSEDTLTYQLVSEFVKNNDCGKMISIYDEPKEVVEFIKQHKPS